jgi:pimeloyl-ACP methyl ester carboxylesterase
VNDTVFWIAAVLLVLVAANIVFAFLARRRHPPAGRFIEVDGTSLHMIERGDKASPALVLLHGNGALTDDMALSGLIDRAATRFRVVVFERPGFGHSSRMRLRLWTPRRQAAAIAQALTALGIKDAIVVGHSWGALVALALALEKNTPARGLLLVSGYYFPTFRLDVWLLSGPGIPVIGDLFRYTISPLLSALILPLLFRIIFAPRPVPDGLLKKYPVSLMVTPRHLRAAAEDTAFMIPAAAGLAPSYTAVTCPVTIIAGEEDRVVAPDQAVRLAALIPRAKLIMLPGLGHMVHHFASNTLVQEAVSLELRGAA